MSKIIKVITLLILIISVMLIYECCMAIDMNSIIHHDTNNDILKFNNIEWLEERESVEYKIGNLITTANIQRDNKLVEDLSLIIKDKQGKMYTSRYPDGYEVYATTITDKESSDNVVGKIAGWNTHNISIEYISNEQEENKQYAFRYTVFISEENNKTDYKAIYDDIKEKLKSKYSMCNIRESSSNATNGDIWAYELYIEDTNNNHIRLVGYNNTKIVTITYSCGDLDQYMIETIIERKKEEEEALKQDLENIKKDSEGL